MVDGSNGNARNSVISCLNDGNEEKRESPYKGTHSSGRSACRKTHSQLTGNYVLRVDAGAGRYNDDNGDKTV